MAGIPPQAHPHTLSPHGGQEEASALTSVTPRVPGTCYLQTTHPFYHPDTPHGNSDGQYN